MQNKKNVSIRALPELGGGGLPLPEFFCALFLLKEKVSSMVATTEKVGKVARIRGWGGGLANSGNARIETFFFCFALVPLSHICIYSMWGPHKRGLNLSAQIFLQRYLVFCKYFERILYTIYMKYSEKGLK